ncbi:MAG: bifunctional 4-hydroxy-2-oxoglutarate aldolase/2-dehydro-3-deoxy-phosphogluconate aldolase [Candidatus Marinimicrobia bacterium]|jgi:Entner-Doudoroff aldolase|nr:bifunctional 4-hydroxy-2-oxoglutarate aldolase/2-dehydro-3-deoxy-phosphogluconate aldolase [Candidatus Neomarinimicrobiota bacterium]
MLTERKDILAEIESRKISAIIRAGDQTVAADAMDAAVKGGFRMVEFTLTTPGAVELIAEFRKSDDDLLVGAGTVMTVDQAREAVGAGAQFLVSPVCNIHVIQEAVKLDVVSIPGTFTATEMETAYQAGADFVKLFPAPANVAEYIRFILAPQPYLKILPTSGVNLDNMLDVLESGAAGIGFVRPLFDPETIRKKNYDDIRHRAEAIVERLASF